MKDIMRWPACFQKHIETAQVLTNSRFYLFHGSTQMELQSWHAQFLDLPRESCAWAFWSQVRMMGFTGDNEDNLHDTFVEIASARLQAKVAVYCVYYWCHSTKVMVLWPIRPGSIEIRKQQFNWNANKNTFLRRKKYSIIPLIPPHYVCMHFADILRKNSLTN